MAMVEKKEYKTVTMERDAADLAFELKTLTKSSVAQIIRESVFAFDALGRGEYPESHLLEVLKMKRGIPRDVPTIRLPEVEADPTGGLVLKEEPYFAPKRMKDQSSGFEEAINEALEKFLGKIQDNPEAMAALVKLNEGVIQKRCPQVKIKKLLENEADLDSFSKELGQASEADYIPHNKRHFMTWGYRDGYRLHVRFENEKFRDGELRYSMAHDQEASKKKAG